ncbi:MAG: T9SS type A sorting domain-containing protein [Aureispira sp.]|nr:T9SS type A sorting domain-containing protein [Aureispira sp.]
MKKLLTALLLISWSTFSFAQITSFPYNEDFEGEPSSSNGASCGGTYNMLTTGWANTGPDTDWFPDDNGTTSFDTGPSGPGSTTTGGVDHNPGTTTGIYLYLETSGGCSANTAILESPVFDFTSAPSPQLDFWYHMYGATMGSMFFEVSTNGGANWTQLWTETGDKGNVWLQATINLAAYGGMSNVKFRFRGLTGSSFTSDMAIDDVTVVNIQPDNAGISALVTPVPGGAPGLSNVDVTLSNFGNNTLNNVTIEWEVNSAAQTSVNYTTPAIPAFGSNTVNLGSYTFPAGVTSIKAWTSLPNGNADTDNGNDTLYASFCTGYSGTFTAGTAASDFLTIQDAIAAFQNCGINGPVTVQVQPGTYNGQVAFSNPIPGASPTNTVTFDGMGTAFLTSGNNGMPTVLLDGAQFITIQNFNITCTATTDSWGVFFTNSANNNQVLNNNIEMPYNAGAFDVGGIVASASFTSYFTLGDNANRNLIKGNRITGGDRGISMVGASGGAIYNVGNRIVDNVLVGIDDYGIYIDEQDSIIIQGNRVDTLYNTFSYGIYCVDFMNFEITRNNVTSPDQGIYLNDANSNTTPASGVRSKFINNMVLAQGDYGVYALDVESTDFWHNTVKGEPGVYASQWDNQVSVRNNIFSSTADYVFENVSTTAILNMDYNIFYADPGNTFFIKWGSPTYADLPAWQAATLGYDANSQEQDPGFLSATDLHVRSPFAYDTGDNLGVLDDVDGDARPGFGSTGYDIGADEFFLPNDDAGILALANPTNPATPGVNNVDFTVQNFGGNAITGVTIEWEVAGVPQTPFTYNPTIPIASGVNVNVGTYNFPGGLTSVKAWTSMPNGVNDQDHNNDTLNAFVCTGLIGTYTVGTPTSDFPTIADALLTLQDCGISGPVTMQVQPGTYMGQQLVFAQPIPGISAVNRVTFDGSNKAAILSHNGSGVNSNATVMFSGASYITLQNFTVITTGTTDAWAVFMNNGCRYLEILNNSIQVTYNPGIFDVGGIVASGSLTSYFTTGDNAAYTRIEGNSITGGDRGICLVGESGTTSYSVGNEIKNNTIYAVDDYCVYLDEQDSAVVSGNNCSDLLGAFSYAIYLIDVMGFEVTGNYIDAVYMGIYANDANSNTTPTRPCLIANNMIAIDPSGNSFAGIYLFDAHQTNIYHNTVKGYPALYGDDLDPQVNIRNNIFTSESDYLVEIRDGFAIGSMDYNLFYNQDPANNAFAIFYGNITYTDLADWQTNGTLGYDANSVEGNPVFVGANDMHLDGALANDKGDNTAGVLVDIDGDVRPATGSVNVDIGADEFTPPNTDAGVIALNSPIIPLSAGLQPVSVRLRNFGIDSIDVVQIEWEYNGVQQGTFTYNQSNIPSLGEVDVTISNVNFAAAPATMRFWTSMPNNTMDERTSNDTLDVDLCPGLAGAYTVGTPSSDYATLEEAIDALENCGVSASVVMEVEAGVYNGHYRIGHIPGASASSTVTFDGGSPTATRITHTGLGADSNATVALVGASYVTLKNLTLETTANSQGWAVQFTQTAHHNNVMNNEIISPYFSGISSVYGVISSNKFNSAGSVGQNGHHNNIEGNRIMGGERGIFLIGADDGGETAGNRIAGNTITDADDYGIYIEFEDDCVITENIVYDIYGNFANGIYVEEISNFEITRNNVISRDVGISITGNFGGVNQKSIDGLVANNMAVSQSGGTGEALYFRYVDNLDVWHNSTYGRPAIYMDEQTNLDFRNNIMYGFSDYALEAMDANNMINMDYNLYYKIGAGSLIRFGTPTYGTLGIWQTTGPAGYDQNSLGSNPFYLSPTNLHTVVSTPAQDAGINVNITEDFDGEPRPQGIAPDMGADEAIRFADDASSVSLLSPTDNNCPDSIDVIVVVGNNGSTTITGGIPVTVNVTGGTTATLSGTSIGILAGDTASVNLGKVSLAAGGTFTFEIITQYGSDANPSNDTLYESISVYPANVLSAVADSVCINEDANLAVTHTTGNSLVVEWYSMATGGTLLGSDSTYVASNLTATTIYYAQLKGCDVTRIPVEAYSRMSPVVALGADTTICASGSLALDAQNTGASYLWSTGQLSQQINVNLANTYSVLVTDQYGCQGVDTVVVGNTVSPTLNPVSTNVTCSGANDGSLAVSNLAGTNYSWSNSATTSTITGLAGGTYTLNVTDTASGCIFTEVYTVTEPSTIAIGGSTITNPCNTNDGAVDITTTGGTPTYSYNWTGGATTEDLANLAAGTYFVTITDAQNCTAVDSVILTGSTPIAVATDSILHESSDLAGGVYVSLSGGVSPYSYSWNTGATTEDLTNLIAGTYTVTVTDANGCTSVESFLVDYTITDFVTSIGAVDALKIFPNPTKDKVWIDLKLNEAKDVRVDTYDATGKLINTLGNSDQLEQVYELDLTGYPVGVYMLRMVIGKDVFTTKVVLENNK